MAESVGPNEPDIPVQVDEQEYLQRMTVNEITTLQLLREWGCPVPRIRPDPTRKPSDPTTAYMLVEHIPGHPFSPRAPLESLRNTIDDYASFIIALSSHPFQSIGALHRSEGGEVDVGPDVHPHHSLDSPLEPDHRFTALYGPYDTELDFWTARFDIRARMALDHRFPPHRRLAQYLLNCEAARIMGTKEEMREKRPTFVRRPDGEGILVDPQGHIKAVLHWQGALVTPMGLAFAAPMVFLDESDILHGTPRSGLYPLEAMLKEAYEARGRPDLALCVVEGRRYHLLFAVLSHPHRLPLINAFRRAWLGDDAEHFDSLDEWYAWGGRTFPNDTDLHRLLDAHVSLLPFLPSCQVDRPVDATEPDQQ